MEMTGTFENGVVKLDESPGWPNGTRVTVVIPEPESTDAALTSKRTLF